jgi:hypothetical protein
LLLTNKCTPAAVRAELIDAQRVECPGPVAQRMKKLALIVALLSVASPVAAQVVTSGGQQQFGVQGGQLAPSQGPITGVICDEEITATFCNVPTGPNTNGYGSSGGSGSSGGAGSNTSSIPPCPEEPPANELCN